MATLTIFYGAANPIKVCGKNVCRLVAFAEKYPGWHTFKQDRSTKRSVASAVRAGCIEVEGNQFKFVYPKDK